MSHHSTPHLYTKRTPGSLENPGSNPLAQALATNSSSKQQQQQQQQPSQQNISSSVSAANAANAVASGKPTMDSSRSVSDSTATNAKQLLNAYVYDFLVKSRLPNTARIFVNEAEVPSVQSSAIVAGSKLGSHQSSQKNSPQINSGANTNTNTNTNTPQTPNSSYQQFQKENNLPNLSVAVDAPQGFLFEWWQVFWDVFQAKNSFSPTSGFKPNNININAANAASQNMAFQYYQLQLMKQRQQQEIGLSTNGQPMMFAPNGGNASMAGNVNMAGNTNGNPMLQQQLMFPQQQLQNLQHPQNQQPPRSLQQQQIPQQAQPGTGTGAQSQGPVQAGQPQLLPPGSQGVPQTIEQQQQQRLVMQMMMKQQQQAQQAQQQQHPLQLPMGVNPMDPSQQQQQLLAGMGPNNNNNSTNNNNNNNNMNLQQQLFLSQQQQQNQSRIQQHAQNQMNSFRQQAAAAQQAQQQHDGSNNNSPANGHRLSQMTPQSDPAQAPPMNGMNFSQQPNMINGQVPPPFVQQQQQQQQQMRMNSVSNGKSVGTKQGSPIMLAGAVGPQSGNRNGNVSVPGNVNNSNPNRNMNALQDYQMQLMLLEKQNKKRLDIARNSGDVNLLSSGLIGQAQAQQQAGPGPQQQGQQAQQQQQQQPQNAQTNRSFTQKPSPATASSSPVLHNKPSPQSTTAKRKKETTGKRGRKASAAGLSGSTPAMNPANTPSLLKKEYTTPLTPASEPASDPKRKRKSTTGNTDSPKKQATAKTTATAASTTSAVAEAKKEKPIKEEEAPVPETKKKEESEMPPPTSFSDPLGQSDQIFSVELLGNGSTDSQNFFGANAQGNQGGIDDIDFDFGQFLESNGDGINDGIGGFNWGNVDAIENGE